MTLKSSMSLIHYYPVTNDDKQCVCAPHEDTGLLTFGVCASLPGESRVCDRGEEERERGENPVVIAYHVCRSCHLRSDEARVRGNRNTHQTRFAFVRFVSFRRFASRTVFVN